LKMSSVKKEMTVATPVIGDEYVLVKKTSELKNDSKEEKKKVEKIDEEKVKPMKLYSEVGNGGGRFGACKALLTYDFTIDPITSSTFQVGIALAPGSDASFTSHWRVLFSEMKMLKAEVQLNFAEFTSTVGHDVALSGIVWGYTPTTVASTMYYADVSDWKTSKFVSWSSNKPVVKYKVPPKFLKTGWTDGQIATSVHPNYGRWMSTNITSSTFHQGAVHICSQKAMFDTERKILGRLLMWMEFRGQY